MKVISKVQLLCAGALVGGALLAGPVAAKESVPSAFSAMQGVAAETLSIEEMQAISGELNAYDIAAFLFDQADRYARFPRLAAFYTRAAEQTLANAVQINLAFARLNILTPCTSSLCPK